MPDRTILQRWQITRGPRVSLRAIEIEDLDRCWRWMNDTEVRRFLGVAPFPISRAEERQWIEGLPSRRDERQMAIVAEDGVHIGNLGLMNFDWTNRHAELGILIGEREYWDKGYGAEAIRLLLGLAFRDMNLNCVWLRVFEYNLRGIRCYEKVGFIHEGRERQRMYRDGRFWDCIRMGMLRDEFIKLYGTGTTAGKF
jgi:diamine N-acetyltransferase